MSLAEGVYRLAVLLPKDERYEMSSQIRRAATSVPSNIAEGHGRESSGAFVQSLRIAQGSLKELETQLLLSARVNLAPMENVEELMKQSDEIGKMLRSLIRSIQRRRNDD